MTLSKSHAVWSGDLKSGKGTMLIGKKESPAPYGFGSRFEGTEGFTPEELLGAAHAGCFSMALANKLASSGAKVNRVKTVAEVKLEKMPSGFAITGIQLNCEADVEGVDAAAFSKAAEEIKTGCPVSKALASVPMQLSAKLLAKK
jgi:osmotically inducible protein OsmC